MTAWMGRQLSDFKPLWAAEQKLIDEMGSGGIVVISPGLPPENALAEHRIRASFIRYLALGGCDRVHVPESGVRVAGVYIQGDGPEGVETKGLNLEGCTLPGDLGLLDCRFPDAAVMRRARISSLYLNRALLAAGLEADGLEARGDVILRGIVAEGEIRLLGAKLGGDLDCVGARFTAQKDAAGNSGDGLSADRMEARGGMLLSGAVTEGAVRLVGAKIGGNLDCVGARFTAQKDSAGDPGDALIADGARVEGVLFWREGAQAIGTIDLTAARFGSICDDPACWPGPGGLLLDRCEYGAFIGTGVSGEERIKWLALQDPARWRKDFWPQPYEQCAKVLREMGHQSDARMVLIEKEKLQRRAHGEALRSKLNAARKARDATPATDGFRRHTDRVFGLWWHLYFRLIWDTVMGIVIGYGRRPEKAGLWMVGFWFVGWLVFGIAAGHGEIKPNSAVVLRSAEWAQCADGGALAVGYETQMECFLAQPEARSYPRFHAGIYSADTLLPIVDLEMQGFWIPDDTTPFGEWARLYLWVQIAAGWGLSLLAVAGFSGLVKSD